MTQIEPRFRYYQPVRPSATTVRRVRHRQFKQSTALSLAVIVVLFSVAFGFSHANPNDPKDGNASAVSSKTATPVNDPAASSTLASTINAILQQHSDIQIGVALQNVSSSGKMQTFGVTTPFVAASTAKVLTAVNYYHLVEKGQASLTTSMGSYDAQFQLKEMINDSDNDAWQSLTDAIGLPELKSYASSIGVDYDTVNNELTPAGMATLLTKLYSGKLLNNDDTDQLLSYMQNTNDESMIPSAVPSDVTVYHKYGLLSGELHDAGIILKDNQAYSLVIYTKSTDDSDDPARIKIIRQIVQAVTDSVYS